LTNLQTKLTWLPFYGSQCSMSRHDRRCMFVWTGGLRCFLWECGEHCPRFIWADVSQHPLVVVEFCECRILAIFGPFWSLVFSEFRMLGLQSSAEFQVSQLTALVTHLPPSSHHLSYDHCLDDNTVLCSVVWQWYAHTCDQSLKLRVALGLGLAFVCLFFNLNYFVLVLFGFLVLGSVSWLKDWLGRTSPKWPVIAEHISF